MEEILKFLSELKNNNNRDWFQSNKEWFLSVKVDHEKIVGGLINKIAAFDEDIQFLSAKDCIFRIYRDVRFSLNKDPYKTAFGAVFCKGGKQSKYAGYYLHIEPGNTFVGGGIWMPPSDILKLLRYEIYNFPEEFIEIIKQSEFSKRFGEISGEKLTRPPKEFPADFEFIDLLKYKSYTVGQQFTDSKVYQGNFLNEVTHTFEVMRPFIKFLNRSIENI